MPSITLRPATLEDVPTLERWDRDPAVISATTDDVDADRAFGEHDWRVELQQQTADYVHRLAREHWLAR